MTLEKFKISPSWSASKEEIWNTLFEPLPDVVPINSKPIHFLSYFQYGIAALFVGVIFLVGFAAFYTQDFETDRGTHLSINLPDGSSVELNAASKLSFKPYWWRFSRDVAMEGEAYFEVKGGSRFEVTSHYGSVAVLGTSFNVKSRYNSFSVTCLTGKVQVTASNQSVVLMPNMEAKMLNEKMTVAENNSATERISWRDNRFIFNNTPLEEVLLEIELQYNIRIARPQKMDYFYTGNFFKTNNPQEVLSIVGKPFGLTLEIVN